MAGAPDPHGGAHRRAGRRLPRPDIARYDRFALRTIPALLLVTAFSFSMSNSGGSLSDAFLAPAITSNNPDVRVDAWVTPPYYTGEAPIYLTGNAANAGDSVNVPQFSELTVRVTGASADEKALFKPADSDTSTEIPEQVADAGKQAPANGDTTAPTAQPVADTASPPAAPARLQWLLAPMCRSWKRAAN